MTLLMACFPTAMAAAFPSSAAIKLERASRELAATFIYEAMMQGDHPLALFQEPSHKAFWFERCPAALNAELEAAAVDKHYEVSVPLTPPPSPATESASPLLAARARRAQKKTHVRSQALQTAVPVPEGAEPTGPAEGGLDRRARASRALVGQMLQRLQPRRDHLEAAIEELLDDDIAHSLPAWDVAVLLLFLSEVTDGLPVPIACKEASALCSTYSDAGPLADRHAARQQHGGDGERKSHTRSYLHNLLGAYAQDRMGYA